jgi:hypothetical protein
MLDSFIGAAEENLDLPNVVVGDGEIGIDGNRAFKRYQGLIVFSQPFQPALKIDRQRVVGLDRQRPVHDESANSSAVAVYANFDIILSLDFFEGWGSSSLSINALPGTSVPKRHTC